MFAFTFEQEIISQQQSPATMDQISLIQTLFMTILENERLRAELANQSSQDISFCIDKKSDFNREQQYRLQIQLKQVKIDNLNAMLKELQLQTFNRDKQMQEIVQRNTLLQMSLRQQINQVRQKANFYKNKYEQQAQSLKKYSKLQAQYKSCKNQLELKSKELANKVIEQQQQLCKVKNYQQILIADHQKRIKQLRITLQNLRNDLTLKQQQCFSLKTTLNDCPKLQELNRWIGKVKEYDQKQIQLCGKMSQMSQQLCVSRQRYRKLQGQYRQLQKIKQQLEVALTQNKGNQDSMVIYFDRLQTYEKVIKQLEEQIRKLQQESKTKDKEHQIKIQTIQKQKQNVIVQWKNIVEEMNKQKNILISLQKQVQRYQEHIANQNQRHNQIIKNEQTSQLNIQMRRVDEERNKSEQLVFQPYSFIQTSKCTEQTNRSTSLQNRKNQLHDSQIQTEVNGLHSQVSYQQSSRQNRAHSAMGRVTSEQRLIYRSDPQSRNSTSRLNTQTSNVSYRQTGCGECVSRIQQIKNDYSNRSLTGLQQNRYLRNQDCRAEIAQITDQKKLLMSKLNIHKPQDPSLNQRGVERNIANLYSKNYRQMNPTSKLTTANSSKQLAYQVNNSNRLQIGRGKLYQQKQNISNMIAKRYTNLLQPN